MTAWMKRIAKLVSFTEAMEQKDEEDQIDRLTGKLWDMVHGLGRALRSIVEDEDTEADAKNRLVGRAYGDFLESAEALFSSPTETVEMGDPTTGDVHVESSFHTGGKKGKKKRKGQAKKMERPGFTLAKIDEDERLVFGWFSVIERDGKAVVDKQDDVIEAKTLEKAAYDFVLDARLAGDRHQRLGVGRLVESVVMTEEKQAAMVDSLEARDIEASMDLGSVGWWGGFHIDDDDVWAAIKSGDFVAFSIGGEATREELAA